MSFTPIDPPQIFPSLIVVRDNHTFTLAYGPLAGIPFKIEDWVKFMKPVPPVPPQPIPCFHIKNNEGARMCSCEDEEYMNEKYYNSQWFEYAEALMIEEGYKQFFLYQQNGKQA